MGRRPIGKRAMTSAERVRRTRERAKAAQLERETVRVNALATRAINAALVSGAADAVMIITAMRNAGLTISRTRRRK